MHCPHSEVEKVFYLFYTTYVKDQGTTYFWSICIKLEQKDRLYVFLDNGCTIIGQDNAQDPKTNSNNLTQPKMIFYWQVHIETKGIVF